MSSLFPDVDTVRLNVKSVPHCTRFDYGRAVIELFRANMIVLSSEVRGDDVETVEGLIQIVNRFMGLSNDDPRLQREGRLLPLYERNRAAGMQVCIRLTPLGGEAWERLAEPDWGRFVSGYTYGATEGKAETSELISPDRDLIVAYMGSYRQR